MNEIMVGELSEFAEGGYRVLRVDAFEFGIFRQGDRLVAYENTVRTTAVRSARAR